MSDTSVTSSALEEALVAAGEAVGASLPSDAPWSARPAAAAPPPPGVDARAVAVDLPGVGRLVLALSGPLARAVQAGPPPAENLVAGVGPALASAVAALCTRLGLAFPDLGDPTEVDPAGSLRAGPAEEAAAVLLYQGDDHSATLALVGASDSDPTGGTPGPPASTGGTPGPPASTGGTPGPPASTGGTPGPPASTAGTPGPPGSTSGTLSPGAPPMAEHQFSPLPASGPSQPSPAAVGMGTRGGPIEMLSDVEMGVTVELGRTRMLVRDILDLSSGSVIELDRAAGAPIDVLVNGTLIARGEVVVIDEEFAIRITEVIGYDEGRGQR
jgi:flagellar motor switch protein FliN